MSTKEPNNKISGKILQSAILRNAASITGALFLIVFGVGLVKFIFIPQLGSETQWGQFGDFMGGILNPILSFVTLYVVVTNYKNDHERSDKLELEKTLSMYIRYYEKTEQELDATITLASPHFSDYVTHPAKSNQRITGSYKIYWKIVDQWKIMKKFYDKIKELDYKNPVIEYNVMKYSVVESRLKTLGYLE